MIYTYVDYTRRIYEYIHLNAQHWYYPMSIHKHDMGKTTQQLEWITSQVPPHEPIIVANQLKAIIILLLILLNTSVKI
jgi:hypothetical protein